MQTILITGANRGIGLELIRQYLQQDDVFIIATARNPQKADDLNALKADNDNLQIIALDINDEQSRQSALAAIKTHTTHLDLLINNAGINDKTPAAAAMGDLVEHNLMHVIQVNAVATLLFTQTCLELLKRAESARLVMISSEMGSIAHTRPGSYAYRMSKATLNMATRTLALDLAEEGIITIALDPGWVQIGMSGSQAPVTPDESIGGMITVISGLSPADNGRYLRYNGESLPW